MRTKTPPPPTQTCERVACTSGPNGTRRTFKPRAGGRTPKRYCSNSCRVLDWQAKHGRVVCWISTDPSGKLLLTVPLPPTLFRA